MNTSGKSVRSKEFVENSLTPITLDLIAMFESSCKLISTLTSSIAVLHKVLDSLSHLSVSLGLLLITFLHGLLELSNILLQWIYNLSQTEVAGLRKFFLTSLQHLVGLSLDLSCNLSHCLIKTCLECIHVLFMSLSPLPFCGFKSFSCLSLRSNHLLSSFCLCRFYSALKLFHSLFRVLKIRLQTSVFSLIY